MKGPILNEEQRVAVEHGTGPLLIIAGAGTGKTTVITQRILHLLLKKQVGPENILALTFTEKASLEMQERIDVALPYGYSDMWIHTFHGFCDRILRAEGLHIGLSTDYTMLTTAQSVLFLRNHIFDVDLKHFRPLGNPDKFVQGLLQHFSRLKDEDVSPEEYTKWVKSQNAKVKRQDEEQKDLSPEEIEELAKAYQTYEELKIKENVLDFGDLISKTLTLFREKAHIRKKYQDKFEYLLIDEFQDTNFAQNQLAILLAGERKNITVVGDDDQAIYRWRGAAVSNMMQFRKHFPDTKIVTLTKNYRSSQTILDTAYKVIQHNNPDRLEVKEKIDKHLVSTNKEIAEHDVVFLQEERDDLEAEAVAKKIEELHSQGFAYKDFAILVRANDHAGPFLRSLTRHVIPHQFLGPAKLFHQEEIKDLIAYLKVLYNREDAQSLYRVLTMPIFHIPANDISLILQSSKKDSQDLFHALEISDTLSLSPKGKEAVGKIKELLAKHMDMVPKSTAGKILYDFLENSGLMSQYLTIKTQDDDLKAQNTSAFFEKLKQFEIHNDNASVYAVVDWIDLSMEIGESPQATEIDWSQTDAVNILTVHSSKGLEFPVVFIVDLVTARFPPRERAEQIPIPKELIKEILPVGDFHMQEERRLFYVALTRAKEYLFLTAAKSYGEGKRERKISPFVFESLGENVTENVVPTPTSAEITYPKQTEVLLAPVKPLTLTYLSYSRIQTFDICPLHYKLKYLLHVPSPQQAGFSFGTSIHLALKEFYTRARAGEEVNAQSMESILKNVWITEGYMGKAHIEASFTGAVNLLEKYVQEQFTTKSLPIEMEFPFQFSLGKLKIGGRMDRIDQHADGSLEIIDYKTGSGLTTEKNIKNNLQLAIYALGAKCLPQVRGMATLPKIAISLLFLESGEKISIPVSDLDLEKAQEKILKKAEEIETSDFTCSKSILCEDCEYKMLCQAVI